MQATNEHKYIKHPKTSMCSACLSADRKLVILLGEFKEIYKIICKNVAQRTNIDVFLCWECLALLRNVKKFQEKALNSQTVLKSCAKNYKKTLNVNFSNLSTTRTNVHNFNKPIDDENDDLKPELTADDNSESLKAHVINSEIKIENDEALSLKLHNDDYDSPFEEIKADSPPEIETDKDFNSLKDPYVSLDILNNFKTETKENSDQTNVGDVKLERNKKDIQPKSLATKSKKNRKSQKRLILSKNRKKLYKIIHKRDSKANIYKRVPIQPQEVHYWMERERNSTYYKNLKYKCYRCASKIVKSHNHNKYHSKALRYHCDFCGFAFDRRSSLTRHLRNHLFVRCCNTCGYRCIQKLHMYSHARQHDSLRVVECLTCRATFNTTWAFYDHYRECHYELSHVFYCDYCQKKFRQKHTIEKHIARHHLPQTCKTCDLSFADYKGLQKHETLKHHIERTEATYCVQCDRQFDNILYFKTHLMTSVAHASERKQAVKKKESHQCPACPNVYVKRTNLRNHYSKEHSEKRRFYCTQCDKAFLTNSKLRMHDKYVHQGLVREKNKICTICGRGFNQKTVLVNHMRTHTGERPYECPQCDAKFAQRTAMLTHCKNIHMKRGANMAPDA